jgi:hypothetical protein
MKILLRCYSETLQHLLPEFTSGEQKFLIDIHIGHLPMPLAFGGITAQAADSFDPNIGVEDFEKKWGIEREPLLAKLRGLDLWQAACIEIWATSFWYGSDHRDVSEPAALTNYLRAHDNAAQIEQALSDLRRAIELVADTRHQFKSARLGEARETAERAYNSLRQLI